MKRVYLVSILALICGMVLAQDNEHVHPMDIAVRISASFAELRADHFHSGIDLSTSGAINIPVKSTKEGYVSRIKIATYGYGYALYVDHPDGTTTVYGHLNSLADKIDKVLCDYQYEHKTFNCDIPLGKEVLPVKKGEVIAYSGNTGGSGGPHLHYEVRETKSEHPLNPLAFLPKIKDDMAPTIMGVKAYSVWNRGDRTIYEGEQYFTNPNNKVITAPAGKVVLGIHCTDYFQQGGRPCGVVEIKLFKNDELIFDSNITDIDFDLTRNINAHIDYAEWVKNKRFIQRSYVLPGNQLGYYEGKGEIDLSYPDTLNMRYEVYDYAGHKSVLPFKLTCSGRKKARLASSPDTYQWNKTYAIDTLGISVVLPQGSLYQDGVLSIKKAKDIWTIGSNDIPLQKAMTITLPVPDSLEVTDVCILSRNSKNQVVYVGGEVKDGKITAQTRSLGKFYVGVDSEAPTVRSRNSKVNLQRSNLIMIGVSDNLSGIGEYEVYIDGEFHPFEFDYKQNMLKARLSRLRLAKGSHKLLAIVSDSRGNSKRFEWSFSLVE